MTPDFVEKVLLFGIAGGVGIICKIVYDWLSNRPDDPAPRARIEVSKCADCDGKCAHHGDLDERMHAVERCTVQIKKEQAGLTASFTAHADHVDKRLDQGHENFRAMRKDIGRMSNSLTTIATIIEERTKRRVDADPKRREGD